MRTSIFLIILATASVAWGQGPVDRTMTMIEPTTRADGEPIWTNGGGLEDCTVHLALETGENLDVIFPASQPQGGGLHEINLAGYEGRVVVTATCRRNMGPRISDPSEEAGPLPRTFPVIPSGVPTLQD